jgi:CDP-glucose 4,6-dehydratase
VLEIERPSVVFHLAAQPLVNESYINPLETFQTNVMGTVNLLNAFSELESSRLFVGVTTDKVYKLDEQKIIRKEDDELGGKDPYAASKAAVEFLVASWPIREDINIATARSGNVIGGGDWAKDRIIPDLVNSFLSGRAPILRYPEAVRPWQHVLDCLNGYLVLIDSMILSGVTGEWNFGPKIDTKQNVRAVAEAAMNYWGLESNWSLDPKANPHEAGYLLLDSTKARTQLGWSDKLGFSETIEWTIDFYREANSGKNVEDLLKNQTKSYLDLVSA